MTAHPVSSSEFPVATSLVEIVLVMPRSSSRGPDLLLAIWSKAGIKEEQIVEYSDAKMFRASVYFSDRRAARKIRKRLNVPRPSQMKIVTRLLRSADWLEAWKKNIKPFRLTKTFDVVPIWAGGPKEKRKVPSGRTRCRQKIWLDTTMAFGTGLHETTRFMAELIESRTGQFKTFLDVGTGSGLLSIVASYCGAKQVDAIDIDPHCLAVARQNLARNGFAFHRLHEGDFLGHPRRRQYDFVAANLFTQDLLRMRDQLSRRVKPGKYLAVSGIALKNLAEIKRSFAASALICRRVKQGKQWAAILYQREEGCVR